MVVTTVGILALQGDFQRHREVFERLNVSSMDVRYSRDLARCDALVIPGGESTTMNRLIDDVGIRGPIQRFAREKPVMGTCAGMIIIAREVNDARVSPLGLINIEVERNAYGRQVDSFVEPLKMFTNGKRVPLTGIFIRAPRIKSVGKGVDVLSSLGGEPVFVRDGHHLATAFHPELSESTAIHEYFAALIQETRLAH